MAVLILAAVRYMFFDLEIRRRVELPKFPPQLTHLLKHQLASKDSRVQVARVSSRWRRKVDSELVENSISKFTHCIVKEFVTDLWFSSVTPDQDVPQQIEALINEVFGEIAHRVKGLNLIELLTRYELLHLLSPPF
jgi:sorting nexin-13